MQKVKFVRPVQFNAGAKVDFGDTQGILLGTVEAEDYVKELTHGAVTKQYAVVVPESFVSETQLVSAKRDLACDFNLNKLAKKCPEGHVVILADDREAELID